MFESQIDMGLNFSSHCSQFSVLFSLAVWPCAKWLPSTNPGFLYVK